MTLGRRAALRTLAVLGAAGPVAACQTGGEPTASPTASTRSTPTPPPATSSPPGAPTALVAMIEARLGATPDPGTPQGEVKHLSEGLASRACANGTLYASSEGAFLVPADVEARWLAVHDLIGYPTSEVEPWVDGRRQRFWGGNVIIAPGDQAAPLRLDVVVNKLRPLVPLDYSPPDLVQWRGITIRESIRADAEAMFVAAASQGVTLQAVSGFRTYAYQVSLFEGYQQTSGPEQTLIRSARPGFSEHQTGFAFDVAGDQGCVLSACFAETNAARWVEAHAFEFGFCVRYGLAQGAITGYDYEPWHLRYVGREVAADMVARKIYTLEQYYGLPAAPNYA